jgi:hypothetical protein
MHEKRKKETDTEHPLLFTLLKAVLGGVIHMYLYSAGTSNHIFFVPINFVS